MQLPATSGDGAIFDRFAAWLADSITVHQPALLVYEAPVISGARTHFQTAFRLIGLAAITEMIGHRREVRKVVSAHIQTVKKIAAGTGRATKIEMIEAMRARGWEPRDEHAADALGVLLWAEAKFSPQTKRGTQYLTRILGGEYRREPASS